MPEGPHRYIQIAHEQEFELYHNDFSLCSKKVRVCLAELGIAYKSHPIDLIETGSYQTLSRRFLVVNPEGVLPVLVHRGQPVYHSHAQIRYAAENAPTSAPQLVPADPALRSQMQRWVACASILGDDPIETTRVSAAACAAGLTIPLFGAMISEIPTQRILEGLLFHRLKIRPLMFLLLKVVGIARFARIKPLVEIVRVSRNHMGLHLDALESQLARSGGPWILGETFSLADVSWMVIFERMAEQNSAHVFLEDGRRPRVLAYWRGLRDRPSYQQAIAGHRHPTVVRGTRRLQEAKASDPRLTRLLDGDRSPAEGADRRQP
jgi:glutathione S-transferase